MAQLEDAKASAFEEYLDTLDANQHAQIGPFVGSLGSMEARLRWARSVITADAAIPLASEVAQWANGSPQVAATQPPGAAAEFGDIPPELVPVLMQLTPEERIGGLQIVSMVDRGT